MKIPKTAVIIPSRDRLDLLVNCVTQFAAKTKHSNYEFHILETGSNEENLAKQENWLKNTTLAVVYSHIPTEGSLYRLYNTYISKLAEEYKYLIFLHNDVELVNDFPTQAILYLEAFPDLATVAPQLRNRDERIASMGYSLIEYENNLVELLHEAPNQTDKLFYSRDFNVASNTSPCFAISRELFLRIGGFPDVYLENYGEVELGLKCILEGKRNLCLGSAIAIHYAHQTRGVSEEVLKREHFDYIQNLLPFIDIYRVELRNAGILRYKDRTILKKDWNLGSSYKIETNFRDLSSGIYKDPSNPHNALLQLDFEKRYSLKSDNNKLHVLMYGHRDGCGLARIDNPAYMLNKVCEDIEAFPTSIITPELINWAHLFVWEVPMPNKINELREFLKKFDIPQVFEIDDDYLHLDTYNLAKKTVNTEGVLDWLKNCNLATVTRESLGNMYKELIPELNFTVCPNSINFDIFPQVKYQTSNDRPIRIGWMGGCTHYTDLLTVASIIQKIKEKYKEKVEICLFGWDGKLKPPFFAPSNVFGDMQYTHINFVDVYKYYEELAKQQFDICFIPLARIPFNDLGKSPLKFLEASAAKIPCIVSDSPVFDFISSGEHAFKPATQEDWYSQLCAMIDNPELRYKLSEAGYKLTYEKFNLEKNIWMWALPYRQLALTKYQCSLPLQSFK